MIRALPILLLLAMANAIAQPAKTSRIGFLYQTAGACKPDDIAASGAGVVLVQDDLYAHGPNRLDLFRRAAGFVDKVLKGAKPATLPFEQPSKFELVVNMKTAAALGIPVPPALVLRADRTIY